MTDDDETNEANEAAVAASLMASFRPVERDEGEPLIQITSHAVRMSLAMQIADFAHANGMSTGAMFLGLLRDRYPQLDIRDEDISQRR